MYKTTALDFEKQQCNYYIMNLWAIQEAWPNQNKLLFIYEIRNSITEVVYPADILQGIIEIACELIFSTRTTVDCKKLVSASFLKHDKKSQYKIVGLTITEVKNNVAKVLKLVRESNRLISLIR